MHIHICPVEITAALMMVEHGIPYIKYTLCSHARKLKDKIMKPKIPVTIWNRVYKERSMFNHMEEGWVDDKYPTPKSDDQMKSWLGDNVEWVRVHAYLIGGKVVEIEDE